MQNKIQFLSDPEKVSMGDGWFEMATPEHFWIKRRFDVFQKLFPTDMSTLTVGEIGSGSGTVQRQCEDKLGITVDGFDLNTFALEKSLARKSNVFCYNIFDRKIELKEKYDIIILFDVLEHITAHNSFMDAILFHLKRGGKLIINVPANQKLYSQYDVAAGHVKRYAPKDFELLGKTANLTTESWTFWGFTFFPLLMIRKWRLRNKSNHDQILKEGFNKRNGLVNKILYFISKVEIIPQHILGTSLMWVFKK